MAIYGFRLDSLCEDRSKTACWVSIEPSIFLQSEIQILCDVDERRRYCSTGAAVYSIGPC